MTRKAIVSITHVIGRSWHATIKHICCLKKAYGRYENFTKAQTKQTKINKELIDAAKVKYNKLDDMRNKSMRKQHGAGDCSLQFQLYIYM